MTIIYKINTHTHAIKLNRNLAINIDNVRKETSDINEVVEKPRLLLIRSDDEKISQNLPETYSKQGNVFF